MPTNLAHVAKIVDTSFAYFPIWRIQLSDSGEEQFLFEPAAATSVTEVRHIRIPGGDLRPYSREIEEQTMLPSVPMDSISERLVDQGLDREQITEIQLIHLPLFTVKYEYVNQTYTALVEGFTGRVFANLFPEGSNLPLKRIALTIAVPFIVFGTFPWLGLLFGGREGQFTGLATCLGLGIVLSLVLVAYVVRLAEKR